MNPRPLSPHLQIYRWYFTMALSILHRASGVALSAGLVLFCWWLVAMASGPEAFATFQAIAGSIFGQLVLFGVTLTGFYHLGNGIRHLFWDMGYGLNVQAAHTSGYVLVAGSVVLTLLTWVTLLASN